MKLSLFVALVSIGLVAGNGAWKENYEYKYSMVEKTWSRLPTDSKEMGTIVKVLLTIRPQSENILIGHFTQLLVTRAGENDSEYDSNSSSSSSAADNGETKSVLMDLPLNKQFQINLRNGVIDLLAVNRNLWTNNQINQLKYVVSQFQVDAKAQNLIRDSGNYQLPDANSNNAYYKTMEPTMFGVCETNYDISRLPEYLSYANYATILSLPKYATGEDVIEIVKQTNYKKCNDRNKITEYIQLEQTENSDLTSNSRIIISGSVDKHTIHSSVFTEKLAGLSKFVYLTLESMEPINKDSNENYNSRDGNLQNIGNLVYKSNNEMTGDSNDNDYSQRVGDKKWNDGTSDCKIDVRLNTESEDNYYNPRFANRANYRNLDNKVDTRVIRDSNEN